MFWTAPLLLVGAAEAAAPVQSAEFAEIRRQLGELTGRLDVLEDQNAALRTENEALRASVAASTATATTLREQAAQLATVAERSKATDWASRISLKGDLRYRHEEIADDIANNPDTNDQRYRDRIRARIGLDARITDDIIAGFMLASGGDDPRSANQSLGGVSTRKSIGLDLAYAEWKYTDWGAVTLGKMRYPVVRAGQSLIFDPDVNPEGVAATFRSGAWFASAYNAWIDERATAADTLLFGGQIGTRTNVGPGNLMAALQYADLAHGEGQRPFYNCTGTAPVSAGTIACANGNTVIGTNSANAVLAYDYNMLGLSTEYGLRIGGRPLLLWGEYFRNLAVDDLDLAWSAGVLLGRAGDPGTWEAGLGYEVLEKDAIYGQLVDSDFGDGRTDAQGWILRGGYALFRNAVLNGTYYHTDRQMDVGSESDYKRLMLDFNVRF